MALNKGSLRRVNSTKLASLLTLLIGAITLVSSVMFSSVILAFIGLGLTFWGLLLLYIRPSHYVKSELLTSVLPSLANIDKVIKEANLEGKGVYLPPKYLKDPESSTVFVPSKQNATLPSPEEVDEEKLFSKNSIGIYLTPPGLSLSQQLEKASGTSFTRTDLKFLQEHLAKLIVEDLEIAKDLYIQTEGNIITVQLVENIFSDICQETMRLEKIHESIGCPLCSAIACALAKTTGKPVTIEKEEQGKDGKTQIQYRIIQEEDRE